MADLGVPDGMIAAVSLRAHSRLHLHLGAGHNSISPGVRAGLHLHPFEYAVAPYLALEAGHYFAGGASSWARNIVEDADIGNAELDSFGYSYGNAHLGLRFGSPSTAVFLQAGVSWIRARATLHDSRSEMLPGPIGQSVPEPTIDVFSQASFSLFSPSARLGLIAYF